MIKIGPYDYLNLIKSYLAQDRPSATTAGDRMSYFGRKLYSYNSVLAIISTIHSNVLYIDSSTRSYSNTTSKQTNRLVTITHSLNWQVFFIDLRSEPANNLATYWSEVESLIGKHNRSRKYKYHIKQSIHSTIRTAQLFAELHELDPTIPDILRRQLFVNQLLK